MPEQIITLSSSPAEGEDPGDTRNVPTEVFLSGWIFETELNPLGWVKTDLIPQWVIWSTAESGLGRAQLLHRYGERFRSGDAGDEGDKFSLVDQVDHQTAFVKIVMGGNGLTEVGQIEDIPVGGSLFRRVWFGQIDAQATAQAGASNEHPAGTQILVANAMENAIFGKHFVLESAYREYGFRSDDPETEFDEGRFFRRKTCRHGITFNEDGEPNQAGSKRGGEKRRGFGDFITRPNRGHPVLDELGGGSGVPVHWSTRDIVQYALRHWIPLTDAGTRLFTIKIDFADFFRLPHWDKPVIETHGFRPLEILRRLLSRRRLFIWWLEVDENLRDDNGAPVIKFRVQTTTNVNVQATGDNAIPANDKWLAIDVDDDASASVQLERDSNSQIDQVVAQGARRRNVMTLDFETPGTTEEPNPVAVHRGSAYWFPSIQEGYEAGATNTLAYRALTVTQRDEKKRLNDQERSRDKFRDVFRRFGMSYEPGLINYPIPPGSPPAWSNGTSYTVGAVVIDVFIIYEVLTSTGEDSTGDNPSEDTEHTYEVFYENCFGQLRLLQKLPLLENHDYSGNNIASGNTENAEIGDVPPQELDMFVLFWIENKKKPGEDITEGRYITGAKLSQLGLNPPKQDEDRDWSTTVRVVKDDTSFLLTVNGTKNRPHTIAKGTFVPIIDVGFLIWAVGQTYSVKQIIQDSGEKFFEITGGDGPSAENDSDLAGGSDTGYTYAETEEPTLNNVDDEDIGQVDWRKMKATICYEDDRFCQSIFPAVSRPAGHVRVLRVDAGRDYRLDWVQGDTVVDLDEEGSVVTSGGGYIRDDRLGLEEIARRAYGFYKTVRGILSLRIDYRNTASGLYLGRLVSRIRNGGADVEPDSAAPPDFQPVWRDVFSVITEIRVDFPYAESETPIDRIGRPTLSLKTSFGELDPRFFVRGSK